MSQISPSEEIRSVTGRRVLGSSREIKDVRNAFAVYEALPIGPPRKLTICWLRIAFCWRVWWMNRVYFAEAG